MSTPTASDQSELDPRDGDTTREAGPVEVPLHFVAKSSDAPTGDGEGCHGGRERLLDAARQAGKSDLLTRYETDYPSGPHDQPQSMCPAFGSLRVGLRMRRTATVLSGSACCVYGLTFTSHFYGAKRTVGYVPFDSETLVTGKLFEDIRDAVHELADPDRFDTVIVTNLCVPTASGVPLDLLPDQINGVRIIGIDVPGFGVPTHAEAKDVLAGAMLRYARREAQQGPVAAPDSRRTDRPTLTLLGELFPADPVSIARLIEPLGLACGPTVPTREWRELYSALDGAAIAALHPFYTASVREFEAAGRPVIGSAPVGVDGTADWLERLGGALGLRRDTIDRARDQAVAATRAVLEQAPIDGSLIVSGYEGSELLVARLAVESGAKVHYVGTACPKTPWSSDDAAWLEARGVQIRYRASLEQDLAALEEFCPDLAIGTTPLVQAAKSRAMPALYFTNLISARPLMGPAGAGSLAQVINAALANRDRFERMRGFFAGVGEGERAGVWEDTPEERPEFRKQYAKRLQKQAAARSSTATT